MDTSEVERIRARVDGNIAHELVDEGNVNDFIQEQLVLARHDCRLLLAHLDAQAAELARLRKIEAAAREVVSDGCHFWYQDAGSYCVEQDAFEALKDALGGEGDGA